MGILGLPVDEFWGLTLRDYITKVEGFYRNRDYQEGLLRRMTFFVTAPYHKKGTEPMDLWVLRSEKQQAELKRSQQEAEANRAFAQALGVKPKI